MEVPQQITNCITVTIVSLKVTLIRDQRSMTNGLGQSKKIIRGTTYDRS